MASSEGMTSLQALSQNLAEVAERAGRSVVAIDARRRIPSSGVVWAKGVVVSADHTIRREEEITVTAHDGRKTPATLAGRDPTTDLAVLKAENLDLPAAGIAGTDTLKAGNLAIAIGRAGHFGASMGVIASLGEAWRTWQGGKIDRLIRPDISIFDGFSGGPLVDVQGRVLGINTSGLSRRSAITIPSETVQRVVAELLEKGRIARAYIGAGLQPVDLPEILRNSLKLSGTGGLVVMNTEPGGPAEKSGMLLGDVLVSLDGAQVGDFSEVQAKLTSGQVGKALRATVIRGGALAELTIVAGERPALAR
ncbi:MAG: trypsin-like peptidase domain-containing protein [Acidobacteriota bacterium]|nr:trypsin-like peptidase domain-containing protein [Acidobacteriota bacterium]